MVDQIEKQIASQIAETQAVLAAMSRDTHLLSSIRLAAEACARALVSGGKLMLLGNGGSAADAQHIAAEFVNYFNFERPGLAAIALTTDSSVMTSISNDSSFERIFSRQVEALGKKEDVLIAYSTSGNSKNVLEAIDKAKNMGIYTIGLTGEHPGGMDGTCDTLIQSPSSSTAKIQEGHLVIGHILSGLVEQIVFSN